jgi:leucyl-tRNA synthetase
MKKVTEDIESLNFNRAISAMMVITNHLQGLKENVPLEAAEKLVFMVSPFAPHLGEECWSLLGHKESLAYAPWVQYDEALCIDSTVTMGVQGGDITIEMDANQETAMAAAQEVAAAKEVEKVPRLNWMARRSRRLSMYRDIF